MFLWKHFLKKILIFVVSANALLGMHFFHSKVSERSTKVSQVFALGPFWVGLTHFEGQCLSNILYQCLWISFSLLPRANSLHGSYSTTSLPETLCQRIISIPFLFSFYFLGERLFLSICFNIKCSVSNAGTLSLPFHFIVRVHNF